VDLGTCAGFTGGGDCTLEAFFQPTTPGPVTATATVQECRMADGNCQNIQYSVTGVGVSVATAR